MGKLYETINSLCIQRGIKASKMCSDIGISRGLITDLKMGRKNGITAVTAQKIASYFNVSVGYLLGEEAEKLPADFGKRLPEMLNQFVGQNPDACSGKRLDFLFTASDYDLSTVCFNLGIEQYYLDNWMQDNDLPPKPIVDKILGVFRLKPEDLFPDGELSEYCAEVQEWGSTGKAPAALDRRLPNYFNQNIIRIAGRDGSYRERTVTDEQLALFAAMFDQLPDVPDDL